MTYKINDELIRHAIYVERLKTGESNKSQEFVENLYSQIEIEMIKSDPKKKKELDKLLIVLGILINDMRIKISNNLKRISIEFSKSEVEYIKDIIENSVDLKKDIEINIPSDIDLEEAIFGDIFEERNLSKQISKFSDSVRDMINLEVKSGFLNNIPIDQVVKNVRNISNITKNQAETLIRTSMAHMYYEATNQFALKNKDIVKSLKYTAILDNRTTLFCAEHDGLIYDVGSEIKLPAHWNCRSIYTYVFKNSEVNDSEQTTRTSTFEEFFSRQSESWKREYLGPKRYELYRKGGLEINNFINNKGETLTIKELKIKNKEAFQKAGL